MKLEETEVLRSNISLQDKKRIRELVEAEFTSYTERQAAENLVRRGALPTYLALCEGNFDNYYFLLKEDQEFLSEIRHLRTQNIVYYPRDEHQIAKLTPFGINLQRFLSQTTKCVTFSDGRLDSAQDLDSQSASVDIGDIDRPVSLQLFVPEAGVGRSLNITAVGAKAISIRANAASLLGDPMLVLKDRIGNKVSEDDDLGPGLNSWLIFEGALDNNYTVSVSSALGGLSGPFNVELVVELLSEKRLLEYRNEKNNSNYTPLSSIDDNELNTLAMSNPSESIPIGELTRRLDGKLWVGTIDSVDGPEKLTISSEFSLNIAVIDEADNIIKRMEDSGEFSIMQAENRKVSVLIDGYGGPFRFSIRRDPEQ